MGLYRISLYSWQYSFFLILYKKLSLHNFLRMVNTVLCGGWLHAVIFSTVPLYWNSWKPNQQCELGRILPRYYTTAIITPAFLVIWTTMFVIYWRIWRKAVQQVNKLRQLHVYHLRQSCFQVSTGLMNFAW